MYSFVFFLVAVSALIALVTASGGGYQGNLNTTSSTCGGNCPGGCDSCPCGTTKNMVSISDWCAKYTGWKQSSCECIVSHESSGNANAVNQNTGSADYKWDVGVWQVNSYNWDSCNGGKAPCDPSQNLACAKKVFGWGGNTWKLWSTCGACGVCNTN